MATWKLVTPLGAIECHKGRSFGERVWKKPDATKMFKVAYFSEKGVPLDSDVFVHINGKWIPQKGNDKYAKRMYYKDWVEQGKPKTIDGKTLGIVVKKVGGDDKKEISSEATLSWNATERKKISLIELKRFVSKDMKYIIPTPESIPMYKELNKMLNQNGEILITKTVYISKNSSVDYKFAIIPLGTHIAYVELLESDLQRDFPLGALIPSDNTEEIADFEDEGEDLI